MYLRHLSRVLNRISTRVQVAIAVLRHGYVDWRYMYYLERGVSLLDDDLVRASDGTFIADGANYL